MRLIDGKKAFSVLFVFAVDKFRLDLDGEGLRLSSLACLMEFLEFLLFTGLTVDCW